MKLKDPLFLFSVKACCLPFHSAKQPCPQHRPVAQGVWPPPDLTGSSVLCFCLQTEGRAGSGVDNLLPAGPGSSKPSCFRKSWSGPGAPPALTRWPEASSLVPLLPQSSSQHLTCRKDTGPILQAPPSVSSSPVLLNTCFSRSIFQEVVALSHAGH